jgi:hypothetical protein
LLLQGLLGAAMFSSSAGAQSHLGPGHVADAGALHAAQATPELDNAPHALEDPELTPGAGLLKRIEDPSVLSERVLAQLEKRAGVDAVPAQAALEPDSARVAERSRVPLAVSPDERRAERQRRTRAFETEAGVTVLSNRNADRAPAPRTRTHDLPSPVAARPSGETLIEPPRLTSTHSLRPLSSARSDSSALGVGLPLLLLLSASTLAGALWWHKKSQI